MLSDLENMDLMLDRNIFERKNRKFGDWVRRHRSPSYDVLGALNINSHTNAGENEIRRFAGNGQNPGVIDFSSEINRFSEKWNQRITQEMNGVMNSVSLQIQRAISEAINDLVLPRIQASLRSGSGQMPQ